ncbi:MULTISPECIES: hypothetical protein [Exiguobacterium]|jgi:hypothetical protein|uniref:Uncharacterized protein n=2 Tax=Exiguobacterium TaxID=33986 RepID=U1LTA6_9BACL|nr:MULTISPECIES: hypothetical protein [Exiguobacterium]ERG65764.1 hypothetical protein M467_00650 [Exiguobacterium chiriqhucha RW-2]MCT4777428.1 hypothetical protein [Exiguobacterium aquaticum]MCT4790018.1 hypothetical protein [Exiguobacterium mexicanum]MDL5376886.1 hypothetical protein [Exiguobacterium mexicanum]
MTEKKLSFQEAMKQKLAEKKQNETKVPTGLRGTKQKPLTNQLTKKPNNQKKRTGV